MSPNDNNPQRPISLPLGYLFGFAMFWHVVLQSLYMSPFFLDGFTIFQRDGTLGQKVDKDWIATSETGSSRCLELV